MKHSPTFSERAAARFGQLSPAERQVARFFQENREEVLVASASELASRIGTSDATVVRATKALGYSGMDELRRQLADELRTILTPASRLTRTLGVVGENPRTALGMTLDIHMKALEDLRRDVTADLFQALIDQIVAAQRVFVFGLGPSSSIAEYFAIQLGRFGIEGASLTQSGLLLADGLHRLRRGDLLIMLAYSRVYGELEAMLLRADRLGLVKILLSDTLGASLGKRVDLFIPVTRGRADSLSMHTATLGLIEAVLVGIAAARPSETVASLALLNELRAQLAGPAMALPTSAQGMKQTALQKRRKHRN